MFGYITIHKDELKIKEYNRYRAFYCGVCHSLGHNYGLRGKVTLTYDMTFVGLLLATLYEDDTPAVKERCIVHPTARHEAIFNEYTDYAAAINVMLAYYKFRDDWEDEKKILPGTFSHVLKRAYKKAAGRYPRQAKAIEEYIRCQHEVEARKEFTIDDAAGPTAHMLAEVLDYRQDCWSDRMRRFGFFLGKFIYLMDAYDDVEKDCRKGNFNPLKEKYNTKDFDKWVKDMLTIYAAEAAKNFEALPIIEDGEIIRNILYAGMWNRFYEVCNMRNNK